MKCDKHEFIFTIEHNTCPYCEIDEMFERLIDEFCILISKLDYKSTQIGDLATKIDYRYNSFRNYDLLKYKKVLLENFLKDFEPILNALTELKMKKES